MRKFFTGFFIALLIGISFGYFWAWKALTKTYELRLEQKEILIDHYRTHWTPIRETPVRHRVK
jgi:hypothetical protein